MTLVEIKTIDDMGRIIIPKEVRDTKSWEKGTKIAIYINDEIVVLKEANDGEEKVTHHP